VGSEAARWLFFIIIFSIHIKIKNLPGRIYLITFMNAAYNHTSGIQINPGYGYNVPSVNSSNNEPPTSALVERFKCAGILMLRGIVAPIVHPLIGAVAVASESLSNRSGLLLNVASNGTGAGFGFVFGGVAGLMTGIATCADALIEGPYQLLHSGRPQRRPWVERKIINSARPNCWSWLDRKLLGLGPSSPR
jgi:hypothetical protein